MKIERTQEEIVSDIASRLSNIENSVLDISMQVDNIVTPLQSSDGSHLTIPDRLDNVSDHLWHIRLVSPNVSFQVQVVIWLLMFVVILMGFVLWRVW